jgi:surface polysaccharide O-acyltransferase-like enzyme
MFARWMITFGRAPFAFYVAHLYLIHLAAIAVAAATKRDGWPLEAVWVIWILVVAALYPLCRLVERLKAQRTGWWWSYV